MRNKKYNWIWNDKCKWFYSTHCYLQLLAALTAPKGDCLAFWESCKCRKWQDRPDEPQNLGGLSLFWENRAPAAPPRGSGQLANLKLQIHKTWTKYVRQQKIMLVHSEVNLGPFYNVTSHQKTHLGWNSALGMKITSKATMLNLFHIIQITEENIGVQNKDYILLSRLFAWKKRQKFLRWNENTFNV